MTAMGSEVAEEVRLLASTDGVMVCVPRFTAFTFGLMTLGLRAATVVPRLMASELRLLPAFSSAFRAGLPHAADG